MKVMTVSDIYIRKIIYIEIGICELG